MVELADAVAVVTGAGARTDRALGIGEATAIRLAADGASVVAVDVDGEMAERTAALIREEGGEAVPVQTDLADEDDVAALADAVAERFGRLDVLVNNAGIRIDEGPVTEADPTDVERIVDVNLLGTIRACAHLVPVMADTGGGAVVNVSSTNALTGRPGWAPYDATKAGMLALTRDMAADHAADGVRVNAVAPGWTTTDYHLPDDEEAAESTLAEWSSRRPDGPGLLQRNADPREQAEAIRFLASDAASYVTGTTLPVDGGAHAVR